MIILFLVGLGVFIVVLVVLVMNASTIDDIEASVEKERFDHGFGAPPSDQSHSLLVGRSQPGAGDHSTEAKP